MSARQRPGDAAVSARQRPEGTDVTTLVLREVSPLGGAPVDIAVGGGRITALLPAGSPVPDGARVVDGRGLVAAVAQQHDTGEVLMLGWMDDEALHRTLTTGRATYWSRSRSEYWVKGDTSGHVQQVVEVRLDCDGDTVLLKVDQTGAACHTGARTCFDEDLLGG